MIPIELVKSTWRDTVHVFVNEKHLLDKEIGYSLFALIWDCKVPFFFQIWEEMYCFKNKSVAL